MMLDFISPMRASPRGTRMARWGNASITTKRIWACRSNNTFVYGRLVIGPIPLIHVEAQLIMLKVAKIGLKEPGNFA